MTASRTPPPFRGFLLAVGGQCRKVGKSTLVADIIQAFPNRHWTAVKITPYAESGCPVNGPSCNCSPEEHAYAIHEETSRAATQTARGSSLPAPIEPCGSKRRSSEYKMRFQPRGRAGKRRPRRNRKRRANEILEAFAVRYGARSLESGFQGFSPRKSRASGCFRLPFAI